MIYVGEVMNSSDSVDSLPDSELRDLIRAKRMLEKPGFTARMANLVGGPVEKGFAMLPKGWSQTVHRAVRSALLRALELALVTLPKGGKRKSSDMLHKIMVGASGAAGGAFGLPALPLELPVSTTLILRSIAEIARDEGHDLSDFRIRLACLEVFALGGKQADDDAAESVYWAVRAALGKAVSEAASYFAQKGIVEKSAPAIVRLISAIAARFGVVVSEQIAAKAIPVVGAAGGSIVNVAFMDHFQQMARGHFIVKRLEAKYGQDKIKELYHSIPASEQAKA